MDWALEAEQLETQVERARRQMVVFEQTVADPATTEADERAYKNLKGKIWFYLGH